jgi:hypothetical protein
MSSFSCQFIEENKNFCTRLKVDCVPGRPGCVLKGRFVFAIPAEKRIEEKNSKQQKDKKK